MRADMDALAGAWEVEGFLADSVVVADGKLYVQGAGWNVIYTQALPMRHPRVGIGLVVRVAYTATNQVHNFTVRLEDQDGTEIGLAQPPPDTEAPDGPVTRIQGQFNIGRPPFLRPGDEQLIPFAINFDGLEFERADRYSFVVEIDGEEAKRLPFRVELH